MRKWLVPNETGETIDLTEFVKQIDFDVTNFKFNKVISGFMSFYNDNKNKRLSNDSCVKIKEVLRIFAPGF
jgi:hypothetical protein